MPTVSVSRVDGGVSVGKEPVTTGLRHWVRVDVRKCCGGEELRTSKGMRPACRAKGEMRLPVTSIPSQNGRRGGPYGVGEAEPFSPVPPASRQDVTGDRNGSDCRKIVERDPGGNLAPQSRTSRLKACRSSVRAAEMRHFETDTSTLNPTTKDGTATRAASIRPRFSGKAAGCHWREKPTHSTVVPSTAPRYREAREVFEGRSTLTIWTRPWRLKYRKCDPYATPRMVWWDCLSQPNLGPATSPHRATPEHRYRRDVVVPDPPIGVIICEPRRLDESGPEDSMLKNNKSYSKETRSEMLQAGVRVPGLLVPFLPYPVFRALAILSFQALLRFPLAHDLVEMSGGSDSIYASFG
ncbi:hypothetical protein B0I37DRAFT_356037 [Chaetomium sp. MPI-CAGE-AT-0009]|nr:hypothetical protein B0I37DRAFT_356037 [Chaetomium sp. MPI-CAGE-AT-0009]